MIKGTLNQDQQREWDTLTEAELLLRRREVTRQDLLGKFYGEDWHGVADAAMDLREIDAELRGMFSEKNLRDGRT